MSGGAPAGQHQGVLAVTVLVASLGLADSINPLTILIAVYLGSGPDPVRRLAAFAAGVFTVYLLGGLILVLGPGGLLRTSLASLEIPGADAVALVAGSALVLLAIVLWTRRERVARTRLPRVLAQPGSALVLGVVVTALDLPTAFPYFAAIGVIVSADAPMVAQLLLLAMFNALYVLPIFLILIIRLVLGVRCHTLLMRLTGAGERIAAPVVAAGAGVVGAALVVRGAQGVLG